MKSISISTLALTLGAAGAMLASPMASARDHVNWSVNVGVPAVGYPAYAAYPAPVYSAPPVVYARPQPVYVEPAPVYYNAPVVVAPAPIYRPAYRPVYYSYYGHGRYWGREHHEHRYYGR